MSEASTEEQRQAQSPFNLSLIVSCLFVVIIALLAFLWRRERSAGAKAQKDLVGMRKMCKEMALREMTIRMQAAGSAGRVHPFTRADLVATREVRLDGKNRQVLEITGAAGLRLGFGAGDVILVSKLPSPATEPASKPSTTSQP